MIVCNKKVEGDSGRAAGRAMKRTRYGMRRANESGDGRSMKSFGTLTGGYGSFLRTL
jgi:hypothetical protein